MISSKLKNASDVITEENPEAVFEVKVTFGEEKIYLVKAANSYEAMVKVKELHYPNIEI